MNAMMSLGPMLLLHTISALNGIDPTIMAPDKGSDPVVIEPSEVTFVESRYREVVIRERPWVPRQRIATIGRGTKLVVRGEVKSRDKNGCRGSVWYAVLPFGYVCSREVKSSDEPPGVELALPVRKGARLPFHYVKVREDNVPTFADRDAVQSGTVSKRLTHGMTVVIRGSVTIDGIQYLETQHGELVDRALVRGSGSGSLWQGIRIQNADPGPLLAWANRDEAPVYSEPNPASDIEPIDHLELRQRVPLWQDDGDWRQIGESRWVRQQHLNEVRIIDTPEDVAKQTRVDETGNDQWIDVDVHEQVLVAYRGSNPVYATLVSSGRGSPTPLGDYPIWAKVASIDMSNQDYEDNAYLVEGVPWVLLFQGHNALHGAYWHDRFGHRKSHGCVNLAPLDARWIFEWVGPAMPHGWTGYLPRPLEHSPVVHVRDSSRSKWIQQRPWGPPDPEVERRKLEQAEQRRALANADAQPALPSFGITDAPHIPTRSVLSGDVTNPIAPLGPRDAG